MAAYAYSTGRYPRPTSIARGPSEKTSRLAWTGCGTGRSNTPHAKETTMSRRASALIKGAEIISRHKRQPTPKSAAQRRARYDQPLLLKNCGPRVA